MDKHCITELEIQRSIKKNRSGGFPLILIFVMIWWGFLGFVYPAVLVVNAIEEGQEHPLQALLWEPLVLILLMGGLSVLLFHFWRKSRKANRPQGFRLAFGRCTDRDFTETDGHTRFTVTAKTEDGAFGEVGVGKDTYETIFVNRELYVLINGDKRIVDLWNAEDSYLSRELLPMLSADDRIRESQKRSGMEAEDAQKRFAEPQLDSEGEAHARGELTEKDRGRIRFKYLVIGVIFLVILLISLIRGAEYILYGLALLVLIGIILETDSGRDCAFVGKTWQKCRREMDTVDPELLEPAIRKKLKLRRLLLAGGMALLSIPSLLVSGLFHLAGRDELMMGWVAVAAAFVLLGLRKAVEALVRKPTNQEEDMIARLLRK